MGAGQVARVAPDGYTLLLGSSSETAKYPAVSTGVTYNPERDFAPVALIATVPLVLTASQDLPVKSVQELIDHARKNPGKLNYGSAGPKSATHLAMALLLSMTGTEMTHVPYRGSGPVVTDLLAGRLQAAIPTLSAVLPYAEGEKLKLLAVSTAKRAAALARNTHNSGERSSGLCDRTLDGTLGSSQDPERNHRTTKCRRVEANLVARAPRNAGKTRGRTLLRPAVSFCRGNPA